MSGLKRGDLKKLQWEYERPLPESAQKRYDTLRTRCLVPNDRGGLEADRYQHIEARWGDQRPVPRDLRSRRPQDVEVRLMRKFDREDE
jgi:hypothetical protein